MPRTRRGPHQRAGARPSQRLIGRILDMEEPLREAADFVGALRQIGNGMMNLSEDDGRPMVAVAQAAGERLDRLRDAWLGLLRVARR